LPARVMLIRMLAVILASFFIPIGYSAARHFLASEKLAIAVMAVISCMPELMVNICRVGNESLSLLVYTSLTLTLLLAFEQPVGLRFLPAAGLLLGLGLVTKAYFLTAVPALVLIAMLAAWRWWAERRRVTVRLGIALALALVISFPWYWRNHTLTGSWSGELNDAAAAHLNKSQLIATIPHVNWAGGVVSVLLSHVWFGGWSFLKLQKPVYALFAGGMLLALLGLLKAVLNWRQQRPRLYTGAPAMGFVLGSLYAMFWLGLLYNVLVVYVNTGVSASDGWYMYALVVAEVLLACGGLLALAPRNWRPAVLPVLAIAFAAIDLYGVNALLLPYYTGLIAHLPGTNIVRPATLQQLMGNVSLLLRHAAVNKPARLGPPTFAVLLVLYYASTLALVAVACVCTRRIDGNVSGKVVPTSEPAVSSLPSGGAV